MRFHRVGVRVEELTYWDGQEVLILKEDYFQITQLNKGY